MISSTRTYAFVLTAAALLASCGCSNYSIFNTAQEQELGLRVVEDIESQVKLLENPVIVDYVKRVGGSVAEQAERQDITYEFSVVDDIQQINAFAVPGGAIYIFTGLLARMKSEAELAAVLGHEVAHIAERHSMEALTRQVGFNTAVQVLLGNNPPGWQQLVTNVGGTLTFLRFSRTDEYQADRLGLEYMHNAGYSPQGVVNLLQLFADLQEREPSKVEVWLSTHPPSSERVKQVRELIEQQNMSGGKTGEQEYQAIMRSISAK